MSEAEKEQIQLLEMEIEYKKCKLDNIIAEIQHLEEEVQNILYNQGEEDDDTEERKSDNSK